MALKPGSGGSTAIRIDDKERAGLSQQARPTLPTEQLGTIQTPEAGGPASTGSPGIQYNPGDAQTSPPPAVDPMVKLFGAQQAGQLGKKQSEFFPAPPISSQQIKQTRTPTEAQAAHALRSPTPRVVGPDAVRPAAGGLPVHGAVSQEGHAFALESPQEIERAREVQLIQEQLPKFLTTDTRLTVAKEAIASGERAGGLNLRSAGDVLADLDEKSDMKSAHIGTDTEESFTGYATKLKRKLERQATVLFERDGNPDFANTLIKAGIMEPGTMVVKPDAARALLLTTGIEGKLQEGVKEAKIQEAAAGVDLWHTSGNKEGIPEKEVQKTLQYSIMTPTFDRQEAQTVFPTRFQQVYGGIDQAGQAKSPLDASEQSLLAVAVFDSMKQIGLVDEVFRQDPDSGMTRGGYEKTLKFKSVMNPVSDIINEYDSKFQVDVSFVELPGGVPAGDSALFHNTTTRSPGKVDLNKAGSAYQAADIAGKTPFGVSNDALGGNAVLLADVMKQEKPHELGYYDSDFASHFLLDKRTLFKYVPPMLEVNQDLELEKEEYILYEKARAGRKTYDAPRAAPSILPTSTENYTDADAFIADYVKLKAAYDLGAAADVAIFEDFWRRRAGPAHRIFKSVSAGYLKAIKDGARLQDLTFFYPQTIQAGTTRTQIATTTLNYQDSKKSRGIVGNVLKYFVFGRTANDLRSGVGKKKRNITTEAIIARNLTEGNVNIDKVDRMSSTRDQAAALSKAMAKKPSGEKSDLEEVALFVSEIMESNAPRVKAWSKKVTDYEKTLKDTNVKDSNIRPGTFHSAAGGFPVLEVSGVDPAKHAAVMRKLAIMMKMVNDKGEPLGKSDHGDFVFRSLKALGDYISKPSMQTDITVEPDGIASGLIIQGRQFGDENYLKHGGVMYDGEKTEFGDTTPLGDMRDLIHGLITGGRLRTEKSILETMNYPVAANAAWTSIYGQIEKSGKIKALHKAAAMTVAYAMHPEFAAKASVDAFFEDIRGSDLDIFIASEIAQAGYTLEAAKQQMYDIETAAVVQALGTSIDQAKAVENGAGLAKLVNEIYEFKGANGWMMQLAGYESIEVASEMYIPVDGGKGTRVTTYATFGDPVAAGKSKKGAPTRKPGTKGEKQAAVMPTQGIDATIAQETIIGIHKELAKYNPNTTHNVDADFAWGGQIFDAFLLDVGSYERGVEIANKKFESVNSNYSIMKQHINAVEALKAKAVKKAREFAKEGRKFDVSPEGEFRGMYFAFQDLQRLANKMKRSQLEGSVAGAISVKEALGYRDTDVIGWDAKGSLLTPDQFLNAIDVYMNVTATLPTLISMHRKIENDKEIVKKMLQDQINEGRPIRQYG